MKKDVETFLKRQREVRRIRLYNMIESLKTLAVPIIGLPLAVVFFLAIIGLLQFTKYTPVMFFIGTIGLVWAYGCVLHDLIAPYLRIELKKIPEYKND